MKQLAALIGFLSLRRAASFPLFNNISDPSESQSSIFVVPESRLEALLHEPPSFTSTASGTAPSSKSIDIVSLGSLTRLDYLTGQISTWARHVYVRNFWGFSEVQDYDTECSSMSAEEREMIVARCKDSSFRGIKDDHDGGEDERMLSFFREYYGLSEGSRLRSHDPGWICAQRRVGRAFGWLHSMYSSRSNEVRAPDYLVMVDDDTYVDLVNVVKHLEKDERARAGQAFASSGCIFEQNQVIPFPISYGGFGTILNKAAVEQLSEPIYCDNGGDHLSPQQKAICDQINKNQVGERSLFEDGMSVFQLFFVYSALKDFCMHSDWVLSYVLEFYLTQSNEVGLDFGEAPPHKNLIGIANYPSCGNLTIATGNTRPCTQFSYSCHNLDPHDMEAWALLSYALSPESYADLPKLNSTDWDVAMRRVGIVEKVEGKERIRIPNLLLIGANADRTTELADWLVSNSVCSPKSIRNETACNNKEVHFFDDISRYSQGVGYYSQYFQHCIDDGTVIMDATPETLMHSERVYDMYQQIDPGLFLNLKSIIVLQEHMSTEFSQMHHNTDGIYPNSSVKTFVHNAWEFVTRLKTWISFFDRQHLLVLSYDELVQHPKRTQWRVEQFLGKNFQTALESVHADDEVVPMCSALSVEPYFTKANEELYQVVHSAVGPWMEQHPFPQVVGPTCFAYASVLGWNPAESQNKVYLDAMRVLIRSLQDSIADFIVMMMYHDKEAEYLLRSEGASVVHIAPLHHSLNITYFEPWFVDIALAKLRAFELTKYSRVQVIDVDTILLDAEKMDDLFTSFADTRLVAEGLGSDSPLRAGWFMIKPSKDDFVSIQGILDRGIFTTEQGWDNLNLRLEYPGWKSNHPSDSWEFYGSQLEQGLLFHHFYSLPKHIDPTLKDNELLTLLDENDLLSYGFVHFYGGRKPWANNTNTETMPLHVLSARELWIKQSMEMKIGARSKESRLYHTLPLTKTGFKRYEQARILYPYYGYAPTSSPSNSPTSSPFTTPSISPSGSPTASPTFSPSNNPSASPSHNPTVGPTTSPTSSPSTSPSVSPSSSPSVSPTESPTTSPSSSPTSSPSASPTSSASPSTSSSPSSPTTSPTALPSMSPSISPTSTPSSSPSASPTASPTFSPSNNPSVSPSHNPTVGPTASPTSSPSTSPSVSPSSSPSVSPTESPTTSPSSSPTKSPSASPTSSTSPSTSSSPSSPTTSPTALPSMSPSISPTSTPSSSPSASPTNSPMTPSSVQPTVSPSVFIPNPGPPTSASPVSAPPTSPATRTTIDVESNFIWNLTCSSFNSTELLDVVKTVEQSIFDGMHPQLSKEQLVFVLLLRLCDNDVPSHPPFSGNARRLVQADTNVTFVVRVTQDCDNCEVQMFNNTNSALEAIVKDGTLQNDIQKNSDGTVNAFINPDSLISTFALITNSPTSSPTFSPSAFPSTSPTKSPSTSPTVSLSPSLSSSPTNPTTSPSSSPTKHPSTSPTISPVASPTVSPTASPTQPPTKKPSTSPTASPTNSPTKIPSPSPSISPTGSPLESIQTPLPTTQSPSKRPSSPPTFTPTNPPTKQPTQPPTTPPTTLGPTHVPTSMTPTQKHTPRPTKADKKPKSEKGPSTSRPVTPRPTEAKSSKMPKSEKSPSSPPPPPTTQRPTTAKSEKSGKVEPNPTTQPPLPTTPRPTAPQQSKTSKTEDPKDDDSKSGKRL